MKPYIVVAIQQFFKDHKISSHSIVVAFGLFTSYVAMNDKARVLFEAFLNRHPTQSFIYGFLIFAFGVYRSSHTIDAQAATVLKDQLK